MTPATAHSFLLPTTSCVRRSCWSVFATSIRSLLDATLKTLRLLGAAAKTYWRGSWTTKVIARVASASRPVAPLLGPEPRLLEDTLRRQRTQRTKARRGRIDPRRDRRF